MSVLFLGSLGMNRSAEQTHFELVVHIYTRILFLTSEYLHAHLFSVLKMNIVARKVLKLLHCTC